MAAVGYVPQTVFQGVGYLSRNAESSQLHTPLQLDRITTNPVSYKTSLRDYDSYTTKPKWGISRNESGLFSNQSPVLHSNNKIADETYRTSHLDKNHLHFGGGSFCYTSVQHSKPQYNVTNLRRSNVRPTDELIPNSNKIDVRLAQLNSPFNAERPYTSHTSRLSVFPGLSAPSRTAKPVDTCAHRWGPTGTTTSFTGTDTTVIDKIKGSPYRREVMQVPNEKIAFQMHDHNFNQLGFSPKISTEQYYPLSRPSHQNIGNQSPRLTVSQNTAKTLRNLHALYNTTEYTHKFTGNGQNQQSFDNFSNAIGGKDEQTSGDIGAPQNHFDINQTNSMVDMNNQKAIQDVESNRPYTSMYKADYSSSALMQTSTKPSPILTKDPKRSSLRNSSAGNKSVKFRDEVEISDGYQTSSGLVNDLNADLKQPTQLQLKKASRPFSAPILGNAVPPGCVHDSLSSSSAINSSLNTTPLRPSTTGSRVRLGSQLLQVQNNYSKSAVHRKFHRDFPESAPDIRRKPDTRITTNERRHIIPEVGCHSFYFHG